MQPTLSNGWPCIYVSTLPLPAIVLTSGILFSLNFYLYLDYGTYQAKVRKSKGVASTPFSKRTKRAGSKRLATPLTVHQLSDEDVPVSMQDDFS